MPTPNKTTSRVHRIATNLSQEIKYWAEILGCSEIEVMPAVKEMLGIPSTKKNANTKRRYRIA